MIYKVSFVQEEYLHAYVEAENEEEAQQIARQLDYEDFESGDCDLLFVEAEQIKD